MLIRVESEEEAGEQLIQDIFGASDEEEEFVVRMKTPDSLLSLFRLSFLLNFFTTRDLNVNSPPNWWSYINIWINKITHLPLL